jgi:Cys-tRNA synthase (O-phospho-L-seryl-tRNA:Cys-tRNA synthase)
MALLHEESKRKMALLHEESKRKMALLHEESKRKMVENCISEGLPLAIVVKVTGISMEEVKAIADAMEKNSFL